jgi:hypothetical protein
LASDDNANESIDVLDSPRVEGGLVDCVCGNHVSERRGVIVGGAGCKNLGLGTDLTRIWIRRSRPLDGVCCIICRRTHGDVADSPVGDAGLNV